MDRLNNAVALSSAGVLFSLHHNVKSHNNLLAIWGTDLEEANN
jgi:hypothetical protein